MIAVDPRNPLPLWRQLEEGVRNLVAAGSLAPGTAVPSVRELARELAVNPATIAKAYQRLSDAGVLEVRRGEGTFVTAGPPTLPRAERRRRLQQAAKSYAAHAATLGLGVEEAVAAAREACEEIEEASSDADSKQQRARR
ncbi:MAG TPA: GntR family transcriptional regulator [Thermoanaerobaculia bacterium]|nr:GntR family transcriptional regulator [Thermoanaerobaculia bacterium]HXT51955.1 GntR family transcriptional regulator [Thermoanaerobaculia bacterium]